MEATYAPTRQEFVDAARRHFAYLPLEFSLPEHPLPNRKAINHFAVRYSNESVLVIVEGIDWGYSVGVSLGRFENPFGSIEPAIPFDPLLKLRRPDLAESCHSTKGQLALLPLYASALRECASDVLSGDLTILKSVAEQMIQEHPFH